MKSTCSHGAYARHYLRRCPEGKVVSGRTKLTGSVGAEAPERPISLQRQTMSPTRCDRAYAGHHLCQRRILTIDGGEGIYIEWSTKLTRSIGAERPQRPVSFQNQTVVPASSNRSHLGHDLHRRRIRHIHTSVDRNTKLAKSVRAKSPERPISLQYKLCSAPAAIALTPVMTCVGVESSAPTIPCESRPSSPFPLEPNDHNDPSVFSTRL